MRRSRATAFVTLLVAAFLLVPGSALAAEERSLGLSATTFDFKAAPGSVGKGELFVINEGDTPIAVKVYAANQRVTKDGKVEFITPPVDANPLTSPASWVSVTLPPDAKTLGNVPYIELEGGARVPVSFEVEIPDGAAPGDSQAVLFFEMFDKQAPEGGTARVNARIGARLKTRVQGAILERLEVRPFKVPGFVMGDADVYSFVVRNSGNVDALVDARLLILDGSEDEVASSVVMTQSPVYAGTVREQAGRLDLTEATIGRYVVRLELSYPSSAADAQGLVKTIEEERTVWVVPVWAVVAAIALAGLLAMYFVWASGRRSAERRLRTERAERRASARAERLAGADDDEGDYSDE